MAPPTTQVQHETAVADIAPLSFFQRYFTRNIDSETAKQQPGATRTFSFRSKGFLVSVGVLVVVLLGIIGAAVGVTVSRASHRRYRNTPGYSPPVRLALDDNFPDPALYRDEKQWYAFATNNAAGILQRPENASSHEYGVSNIQVATSTNFVDWTLLNSTHDPLPTTGAWVVQGHTNGTNPGVPKANVWAPSVTRRKSDRGDYIMYYAAARNRLAEADLQDDNTPNPDRHEFAILPNHPAPHCIGAATASSILGPYKPLPSPLACPVSAGGAIDAAAFTDHDNTPYLLYKVDGNNIGHGGECGNTAKPRQPTPIMLQRLKADGLSAEEGSPVQILDRTASDGPLVEAPDLVRSPEGVYFLFFSSGCTRAPSYDLKYATASNISGPYTRADRPLLQTGDWGLLHAPGSAGLLADGEGGWDVVFHARVAGEQGRVRAMFSGKLRFEGTEVRFVEWNEKMRA
jgi:beta-xylosidase